MDQELSLRIILKNPPIGVDFGLQKGSGHPYGIIQKQRSDSQDLQFEFTVRVKSSLDKNAVPVFLGPFAQGPPDTRFVYIDIGTAAGQADSIWSRRLKIPLQGITWAMIDQVSANIGQILETQVPGTGKDAGPTCGTVKPFTGWQVR